MIKKTRRDAVLQGIKENYEILIFDDGLQEMDIEFDLKFVCFKSKNWVGNGLLIPAGPMREKISKKINNINQATNILKKLLKYKTTKKNIKNKINGIGQKILKKNMDEVNLILKNSEL